MRNSLALLLLVITLGFTSCISVKSTKMDFIDADQLGENAEMLSVKLPTTLAKPIIIKSLKKEGESKEVIQLVKGIKKAKILTISNFHPSVIHSFENYLKQEQIEELMVLNKEGEEISIHGKYNNETINRLLLQVKSTNDEIVYLDLKGKFKFEDLSKLTLP